MVGPLVKSPQGEEAAALGSIVAERFGTNAQLLRGATGSIPVSWGGISTVLVAMHGLGAALRMSKDWEYWVNILPSHLPLLTPSELGLVLRYSAAANASFVEGTPWRQLSADMEAAEAAVLRLRGQTYHEDERLFIKTSTWRAHMPLAMEGQTPIRPTPELFELWFGDPWCVLHRSFAEYVHYSPDNVARLLLNYFSYSKVPDESYFQTTACHPSRPDDPPVTNASLHYTTPFGTMSNGNFVPGGPYPVPMDPGWAAEALASGNLFAGRFDIDDELSSRAAAAIAEVLAGSDPATAAKESAARISRALMKIQTAKPLCPSHHRKEVYGGAEEVAAAAAAALSPERQRQRQRLQRQRLQRQPGRGRVSPAWFLPRAPP